MKPFGFPKKERLCSKKSIDILFANGKSVFSYPIRTVFHVEELNENDSPIMAMFVIPKRKIKKAAHRNFIKRKIRESFRLNKQLLHNYCFDSKIKISLAFMYVSSEPAKYAVIEQAVIYALNEVVEKEIKHK